MTKYGIDPTVICQIIDLANRHHIKMEMSRNVQSGNTQNLKSPFVNQAACCACTHSLYFTGGSPSGLRV